MVIVDKFKIPINIQPNKNNAVYFKSNEIKPDSVELNKKNKTKTILEIVGASVALIIGAIFTIKHFNSKNIKNVVKKVEKRTKNTASGIPSSTSIAPNGNNSKKKVTDIPTMNSNTNLETNKILKYLSTEELKNINNSDLVKYNVITPEMKLMFAQIKDLQGEEFIKKAYNLMTKLLGYENCAPKLIFVTGDKDVKASYGIFSGDIKFDSSYYTGGLSFQMNALSTIRHELEHFKQDTDVVRAEGLGIDALCMASAKSIVRRLKIDKDFCVKIFNKPFEKLTMDENGLLKYYFNDNKSTINTPFYEKVIQEKGIILKDTPESKKAEQYLEASANYISGKECNNETLLNEYQNNLLEQEADYVGVWFSNYFSNFKHSLKK